ncbi:hypothetical protein [Streptomyces sp. GESEQ-4]|uniref:hypothetical protein n=1 Tax=Streptomyces sp. GESEQ-4 TaxID=2812655 RepID=UPI001B32C014|nr:hypothetical protein [Streptomyces sp. GESEQ-4]
MNYNVDGPYTAWLGDERCSPSYDEVDYAVDDLRGVRYPVNNPDNVSENKTYSSVTVDTGDSPACEIKLYGGVGHSGSSSGWIGACTNLNGSGEGDCPAVSSWNNRATSFKLS